MSWWSKIVNLLRGNTPQDERRTFEINERALKSLRKLAELERRTPNEMATRLFNEALQERLNAETSLDRWKLLSAREQQVAALICLGYSSNEIAIRLGISPETVKTHARNILYKYNLSTRQELRYILANWNFSDWDQ